MRTKRTWFQLALQAYLKLSPTEQHRLRRIVEHGPVGRFWLDDGLIAAGFVEPYPRPSYSTSDLPPESSLQVIAADLGLWWERFESTREWNQAVELAISKKD